MKKVCLVINAVLTAFMYASIEADVKATIDELSSVGKKATENIGALKHIFDKKPKPVYCAIRPASTYAPTVEDASVIEQDTEKMIPTIRKYAPIAYLCNELYYPIAAEDYFTAPTTQLVYQPNHSKNPSGPKTIVIPRGQVTMDKIYENRTKYSGGDYFFEIGKCTEFGSNPAQFSDKNGNLTTPIYVTWHTHKGKIYIVYVFSYGYNGAYPVSMPLMGAHEFDLEHITLELNANKQLERIFFATHTSAEGVWLPANHKDIKYEGTHPVVHVAQSGHGSYPREGTHVRIYGFGNDITCKTKKWIPQLVLMYPEHDSRFNPKTMGWAYHSGSYGARGVSSLKRFFGNINELNSGEPHDNVQFCPNPKNPNNPIDLIKYQACIESDRLDAKIRKRGTPPSTTK